MSKAIPRGLLAALLSSFFLLFGSAILLAAFYLIALAMDLAPDPGQARLAIAIYFKVVVLKGLFPQLILTLGIQRLLWRISMRWPLDGIPAGWSAFALWLLSAALAYSIVVPLLLSVDFPGWPALEMVSASNHIWSFVLMTAAVLICAKVPFWIGRLKLSQDESGTAVD